MNVTESGITIDLRDVQRSKAWLSIDLTDVGIMMDSMAAHSLNAFAWMTSVPSSMITLSTSLGTSSGGDSVP